MSQARTSSGDSGEPSVSGSLNHARWNPLIRAGAWSAMLFVALVFVPLFLLFAAPAVPAGDGRAILDYINAHPVAYIVQLVCFVGLSLPALLVFAALGIALLPHAQAPRW